MEQTLRALVVDDEMLIRDLTARALEREGFQCDIAADGNEALELAEANRYDAVVTDLRMPQRHGHSLAVELLRREGRPLIFVLTAVTEPRMAKDLLNRGVDDVMFKPIEYSLFAAKVSGLVQQRHSRRFDDSDDLGPAPLNLGESKIAPASTDHFRAATPCPVVEPDPLDPAELRRGLSRCEEVIPLCLEAIRSATTTGNQFCESVIAATEETHAAVSPGGRQAAAESIHPVERVKYDELPHNAQLASPQSGQLRSDCETAGVESDPRLHSVPLKAIYHRGVAAAFAMGLLIDQGRHEQIADDLVLCSMLQELGRAALATLYPEHYERLLACCHQTQQSLSELEETTLSAGRHTVIREILHRFDLPDTLLATVRHADSDFIAVNRLHEPLRSQVALIKLAKLVALIATDAWQPWDEVEVPPADLVERLRLPSIESIVEQIRSNRSGIEWLAIRLAGDIGPDAAEDQRREMHPAHSVEYHRAVDDPYDFLASIISSMRVELIPRFNPLDTRRQVVANCVGVTGDELLTMIDFCLCSHIQVISDRQNEQYSCQFQGALSLPVSYAALQQTVLSASDDVTASLATV